MNHEEIIQWLLNGDVSIRYQTYRDLLDDDRPELQNKIGTEGWGLKYIANRRPDGHWGLKFYQPKWTSTHYTMLDLKNLNINQDHAISRDTVKMIAEHEKGPDGGINPAGSVGNSDVCINGMFMNYASWFGIEEHLLHPVVDFVLSQSMQDGGFNCMLNRKGARHSSLHTTISMLEGINEYKRNGYQYRLDELEEAEATSKEFMLAHHLFKSDKTGKIIKKDFLRMSYPCRWRYDILRALDYLQDSKTPWDQRMEEALEILILKKNKNNTWNLQAKHKGETHFDMEKPGSPSRWNTLRVLRVLKHFKPEHDKNPL